jgi:hypothetical protein
MQWPGWRRDGGDGRTGPTVTEVTAPTGLMSRRSPVRAWSSRSSSLRGFRHPFSRVRHVGRTGVGGTVPWGCCWPCRTASHSGGDGLAGGVGRAVPGAWFPGAPWHGFAFDWAPANVSALNPPIGGAGMGAAGLRGPRARRNLARGGVQLSIETVPHSRGRPAPERGGVPPEGATGARARRNRARRSFTGAAPCPSGEAEFRPRVARPIVWWAVGPWVYLTCVLRFVCVCFLRR